MLAERNNEACHSRRQLSGASTESESKLLLLPFLKRSSRKEREPPGAACIRLGCGGTAYIEAMCLMVDAIQDCQVVLCRGMGWRAAQELVRRGINPLVIQDELTPRQAVQKYLAGELTPAQGFCRNTGRPRHE